MEKKIAELEANPQDPVAMKDLRIAKLQLAANKLSGKKFSAEDSEKFEEFLKKADALKSDSADADIAALEQTLAELQAAPEAAGATVKASWYYMKDFTATGATIKAQCLRAAGLNNLFNFLPGDGKNSCHNDAENACAIPKDKWKAERVKDDKLTCASAVISEKEIRDSAKNKCGTLVIEEITCS